ncbi:UvrD-helicase domain-containing protein [Moraxella cuniculi]|uniref:RecBCD enzyme subunit RecB n=1 Tax=Moraxella cuniculi TaxID=34061 RepID=A0A448GX31_9GAMM|nr:UvrD-helicase domain-containing protein [Moraxella cuniculi]VEG13322.1 Exodeoxyribonuclease V beta chain [Moraxella cuniculi]
MSNASLSSSQNTKNPTGIAAIDCSLEQAYLIEASAGTGKTWTLTGIILRLLIEKRYPPERIIATTFTRAAAAEMQERISERLHGFYALLRWLQSMQAQKPAWFGLQDKSEIFDDIINQARLAGYDSDDPINVHLLQFILNQPINYLAEVINRTSLLLTTLDKLFVGTLDSLAQKWLKEFAAQIGHQSDLEMLTDAGDRVFALVHDGLRAEEIRLKNNNPEIYQLLKKNSPKFFGNIDGIANMANQAMNFFGSPIDTLPHAPSMAEIQDHLNEILATDFSGFEPYFQQEYRRENGIKLALTFSKSLNLLPELVDLARVHGVDFIHHLNENQQKFQQKTLEVGRGQWDIFTKKASDQQVQAFLQLPLERLQQLCGFAEFLDNCVKQHQAVIAINIINKVRDNIAGLMESVGQTTFTLQMVRLNAALKNNPALARHIRHHYPVALIDESQDINGLQAELIRLIYLDELLNYQKNLHRYQQVGGDKPKLPRGFLLLVGDPKQAIYRFRGGDVANYNFIKNFGKSTSGEPLINQSLVLDVNRRSNAKLISALNTWFVDNGGVGVENHANLGEGIFYRTINAHQQTQALSWQNTKSDAVLGSTPVSILHFDHVSEDERSYQDYAIAAHINYILQSQHTISGRAINPSDIAVLSYTTAALMPIAQALTQLGINCVSPRDENVFTTQAAADVLALLQAVVYQNRQEYLANWLVSDIVGLTLDEAMAILSDDKSTTHTTAKIKLASYLRRIWDKWQKSGLASALGYALQHTPIDIASQSSQANPSLWLSAAGLGERYLADLERVVELCGNESVATNPLVFIKWYHQQMHKEANEDNKRSNLLGESGVHLMTVHKSKGLEFAIVYVLGLGKGLNSRMPLQLYAYSDEQYQRRLSATANKYGDDNYYAELDDKEQIDEKRRLGYVALTRASEQLYVVATDAHAATKLAQRPIFQWLENTNDKALSLACRLDGQVGWIKMEDVPLLDTRYEQHIDKLEPKAYVPWSQIMHKNTFIAEHKTSFTALITRLDSQQLAPDDRHSDRLGELMTDEALTDGTEIRADFIKGAVAGEFLHKVLQYLPTDEMGVIDMARAYERIAAVVAEQGRRLGLPEKYLQPNEDATAYCEHRQLVAWLYDIAWAKFAASHTALAELARVQQLRELGFVMGLGEQFSVALINEVFAKYSDKSLILLDDGYTDVCYRYLRGEIDLVYESAGKFYVVDYKSNYLGDGIDDYTSANLEQAMNRAGYWLQAAIYQVALHRLLKVRIADYDGNEARYLGGVEYVFLRGIYPHDTVAGRLLWQPPLELIIELDRIL